jgi:phospholipid/cholesterol/gamma-HCH transport system permease protein
MLGQTGSQFWSRAWQSVEWNDITQGLLKPFIYALVISLVGCFYGIRTTGGTQGVGRATTQAVVVSIVWIFILNLVITKTFVSASP